jgi:DNA-binding NarL/FixJ family response regulator
MVKRPRVLLADDHALILAGIRGLLEPQYDIVQQVSDGLSMVEAALRLRPDLIILDISLPRLNGIDAARQLKQVWPEVKILFLTMHASPMYLREAMDAGGLGYVLKTSAFEDLKIAVQKVLKGERYVTHSFDRDVLETVDASTPGCPRPTVRLTERQTEVLRLVAGGSGNKEIADRLHVSVKTVEFHRGRIMAKLGAHNVADLIRYAVQSGIVGM